MGRSDLRRPRPLFFFLLGSIHGQAGNRQDQARQQRGYGIFLRDQEKPADADREAQLQEVRPGRAQARRVQGIEDQVTRRAYDSSPPASAGLGPSSDWLARLSILSISGSSPGVADSAGASLSLSKSSTVWANFITEIGFDT